MSQGVGAAVAIHSDSPSPSEPRPAGGAQAALPAPAAALRGLWTSLLWVPGHPPVSSKNTDQSEGAVWRGGAGRLRKAPIGRKLEGQGQTTNEQQSQFTLLSLHHTLSLDLPLLAHGPGAVTGISFGFDSS